jgi:anti-anti-sigma factor
MEQGHDSPLHIDVSAHGAKVTVVVAGELDITTATSMSRRLLAIGAAHPERLVLDLSGLAFIDVAGARALDEAHKALTGECPVTVRPPRPSARKIFELTGLMGISPSRNTKPIPAAVLGRFNAACRLVRRAVPHPAGMPK